MTVSVACSVISCSRAAGRRAPASGRTGCQVGGGLGREVDLGAGRPRHAGSRGRLRRRPASSPGDVDVEHHPGLLVAGDGAPRLGRLVDDTEARPSTDVARVDHLGAGLAVELEVVGHLAGVRDVHDHLGAGRHLDRRRSDVELAELDVEHQRRGGPAAACAAGARPHPRRWHASPIPPPPRWQSGRWRRSRR